MTITSMTTVGHVSTVTCAAISGESPTVGQSTAHGGLVVAVQGSTVTVTASDDLATRIRDGLLTLALEG